MDDDPFVQALAIMREKGSRIMLADLQKIEERMIIGLDPERYAELIGWIYEGLSLTVNDPSYRGDIRPYEADEEEEEE